jgi:hypothetical protein
MSASSEGPAGAAEDDAAHVQRRVGTGAVHLARERLHNCGDSDSGALLLAWAHMHFVFAEAGDATALLTSADQRLHATKIGGRNRVVALVNSP